MSSSQDTALKRQLASASSSDRKTIMFILGADRLRNELADLSQLFEHHWHKAKGMMTLVYLFSSNITYEQHRRMLGTFTTMYHNVKYCTHHPPHDVEHFLKHLEDQFGCQLPLSIKRRIMKECGGRFWLLKEAVRIYLDTKDVNSLADHKDMSMRIEHILIELTGDERDFLILHASSPRSRQPMRPEIVENLIKVGYLKKTGKRTRIAIPLLEKYLRKKYSVPMIIRTEDGWTLDGIPLKHVLNQKERVLLEYFLLNNKHLVTREAVAKVVWNGNNYTDYSDWALDRAISRLRETMQGYGIEREWLRTIKGTGYISSIETK